MLLFEHIHLLQTKPFTAFANPSVSGRVSSMSSRAYIGTLAAANLSSQQQIPSANLWEACVAGRHSSACLLRNDAKVRGDCDQVQKVEKHGDAMHHALVWAPNQRSCQWSGFQTFVSQTYVSAMEDQSIHNAKKMFVSSQWPNFFFASKCGALFKSETSGPSWAS